MWISRNCSDHTAAHRAGRRHRLSAQPDPPGSDRGSRRCPTSPAPPSGRDASPQDRCIVGNSHISYAVQFLASPAEPSHGRIVVGGIGTPPEAGIGRSARTWLRGPTSPTRGRGPGPRSAEVRTSSSTNGGHHAAGPRRPWHSGFGVFRDVLFQPWYVVRCRRHGDDIVTLRSLQDRTFALQLVRAGKPEFVDRATGSRLVHGNVHLARVLIDGDAPAKAGRVGFAADVCTGLAHSVRRAGGTRGTRDQLHVLRGRFPVLAVSGVSGKVRAPGKEDQRMWSAPTIGCRFAKSLMILTAKAM